MRILLWFLIVPVLLLACALAMIWMPLPRPLPPAGSHERNLPAAIITGVLGIAAVVGLVVMAVSSVVQASRVLDPVLLSAGLSSRGYMLFGQQYHGSVRGRQVDVYYVPNRSIWSPLLNIYVRADTGTRAAIGTGKPLLDCRDCPLVAVGEPDVGYLQIYAEDEAWVGRLLAEPANRAALSRLLDRQGAGGFRELYVQPERLWLRWRPQGVSESHVRQGLDDLLSLAEACESQR